MNPSFLIKNGRVIDGSGNPWYKAYVYVHDGRIAHIERSLDVEADRTIDANGMVVCPGFIDTHTHTDGTMFLDPKVESSIRQGITTQVIGNCGCGFAPVNPARKVELESYVRRLLPVDLDSRWNTYGEYMHEMACCGCSTNIVPLITHGAVRIAVMGFDNRVPRPEELGSMKHLVSEGMEAGAFGFSTGLIYPPCIYAETPELIELGKTVADHNGIFSIHIRGEGTTLIPAINEALEISRKTGVRLHISHHKAAGRLNWGKTKKTLKMIEDERDDEVEVTFDQYPYIAGATVLSTLLPPWTHEGGLNRLLERLKDPDTRKKIKEEMQKQGECWENMVHSNRWDSIYISVLKTEKNKRFEGKNIPEIKDMRGDADEFKTLFDLLLEEDGEVRMIVFSQDEAEMRQVMRHPLHMVGSDGRSVAPYGLLSIGKPHPRFYGTFPRFLGKYVREEKLLSLENAIRSITSYPAQTFKIKSKGLLRESMDADIVIFDPDTIIDRSTYSDPHKFPLGIDFVLVNGEIVVEKGEHTGALPGKTLKFSSIF